MEKCILFGAGVTGERAWYKFREHYEITAYADNNQQLWGMKVNGLSIICPEELKKQKDQLVIICSDYYKEIAEQLEAMGMERIVIVEPTGCMLYTYSKKEKMMPLQVPHSGVLGKEKENDRVRNILFVQQIPCIRTHKIASILRGKGIKVSLAYTEEHPARQHAEFVSVYDEIYAISSMTELIAFVNESDYDLVHSSNEPDSLTNLLLLSNKKIVHDTHDMMSLAYEIEMNGLTLEHIANVKSHGNIYVNESNRQIALRKFLIPQEKTLVLENRPLESYQPKRYLQKLSAVDGEMHCVYEGSMSTDSNSYRYFEDIWMKLANEGIHIHFYSRQAEVHCKKLEKKHPCLHYEGCLEMSDLITQMTQYDCGLVLFNVTDQFRVHLETSLANKIFDYLCAGIPEAINIQGTNRDFIEEYKIGAYLNMEGDIKKQLEEIASIQINRDFFQKNNLTMNTRADDLIAFYDQIIHQ